MVHLKHPMSTSLSEHVIGHGSHRFYVQSMCYLRGRNMLNISSFRCTSEKSAFTQGLRLCTLSLRDPGVP